MLFPHDIVRIYFFDERFSVISEKIIDASYGMYVKHNFIKGYALKFPLSYYVIFTLTHANLYYNVN